MIAASSLNDAHGDCSAAAPPALAGTCAAKPRAAPQSWTGAGDPLPTPVQPPRAIAGPRGASRAQKCTKSAFTGGICPCPPGPCPAPGREPLERHPAAGLRDMGTLLGWHQHCRRPDEVELGASPSLPGHRRSPQHPARHSRTSRGTPGTPKQRGAVGSRAPALLPRAGPAALPSLCFIPHQLGPSASPKSALRDPQPPLARLPARASPAKSQRASPVICSKPAGSRHSINVLRQGLPFASKVPNSRGVGVVLTFMRYL